MNTLLMGNYINLGEEYISKTFGLTRTGYKALVIAMWALCEREISKGVIELNENTLDDYLSENSIDKKSLSNQSFRRGVIKILEAGIISKTQKKYVYKVNAKVFFK